MTDDTQHPANEEQRSCLEVPTIQRQDDALHELVATLLAEQAQLRAQLDTAHRLIDRLLNIASNV